MQHLTPHITNATNTFTADDMAMFRRAARKAEQFVKHTLPLDYPIDVIIAAPHAHLTTIPEGGIDGRTYHSRLLPLCSTHRSTSPPKLLYTKRFATSLRLQSVGKR